MGEIWTTGDIHGDPKRLSAQIFPEGKNMDKTDVVEILGDFGLVWDYRGETHEEKYWLDWLDKKPWTTVATLGNHENYDRIEKLPVEERFDAPVWVLRPNVYLLQSGYVYNINGKKIWNFNGASSHDIDDGIIDSENWKEIAKEWERQGKHFRVKGITWWDQEIEKDLKVYDRGIENLEKAGFDVDFVWTHCVSGNTAAIMGFFENDPLTNYFNKIDELFKEHGKSPKWLFGHYHRNMNVEFHKYCLYEQIIQIA